MCAPAHHPGDEHELPELSIAECVGCVAEYLIQKPESVVDQVKSQHFTTPPKYLLVTTDSHFQKRRSFDISHGGKA